MNGKLYSPLIVCHDHRYRLLTGKDRNRLVIFSANLSTVNCHRSAGYIVCRWHLVTCSLKDSVGCVYAVSRVAVYAQPPHLAQISGIRLSHNYCRAAAGVLRVASARMGRRCCPALSHLSVRTLTQS